MRRPLLSVFSVISLVVLAMLALGCVSRYGVGLFHCAAAQSKALELSLQLQSGRVAFYWEAWSKPPSTSPIGIHIYRRALRWRAPDYRRMIWEFDAHRVSAPGPGPWVFLVAFPIWCVALPCLIAPLGWMRTRQRPKYLGFAVIVANDAGDETGAILNC